jgi:hypothetical protein
MIIVSRPHGASWPGGATWPWRHTRGVPLEMAGTACAATVIAWHTGADAGRASLPPHVQEGSLETIRSAIASTSAGLDGSSAQACRSETGLRSDQARALPKKG